jgi:type IV pilus assembly protein PilO
MGKISKEQQVIVAVVVGLLFLGYFYWTSMLSPTLKAIDQKKVTLADLEAKVAHAEQQAKRLPALQRELEQLQIELAVLEKQLPTAKDMPGVLRIVTREALQENVNFVSLRPLEPRREGFFDVLDFEVAMTGGLTSFVRFIASLGQQDRIFQIEQVRMGLSGQATDSTGAPTLNINFLLKTYAYAG